MKLTTTLLLFAILTATAGSTYSQSTRINLKMKDASLVDVFREIERTSEFGFFFKSEELDLNKHVSIDLKNATINEILEKILINNYSYRILDKNIIITKSSEKTNVNEQQQKSVSGTVTDSSGAGLPGVSVVVKGTTTGVITDMDGKYTLPKVPENATLQFSFVGMKTQEIVVAGKTIINVTLADETIGIDEVVAIGYGTIKKSDLTGSVSSVSSDEIKSRPISGINQALQGTISGVQVTQNSNSAGGGIQIRVRGGNSISANNEPLYVIDGFPISNPSIASGAGNSNASTNILATLSPNDIESMEVLKDASATAIYGSRGANGVVLITTKRGKEGQSNIDFETYYSVSKITKFFDMLNASESLQLKNEQLVNLGRSPRFGVNGDPAYGQKALEDYLPGTDWQRAVFQTAPTQNYQLTFSGGNDKVRYLVSGNYFDQDGIMITNNFKRYSSRINLDAKINDKLKLGANFTYSRSDNSMVSDGESLKQALLATPAQQVYNADGTYTLNFPGMVSGFPNPVAYLKTTTNLLQNDRTLGTLFGEIRLAEGLTGRVSIGTDILNSRRNVFFTPQTIAASSTNGLGSIGTSVNTNILNENTLSYTKTFDKIHAIDLLVGVTFQTNKEVRQYTVAQDFPNYSLGANNLAFANKLVSSSGSIAKSGLASYLGRVNYRLKDRYLFTITARMDGSSKFGANNKYGFFPSTAFAWRVSDEPFLANIDLISDLKFRLSYGLTGNEGIGLYNSLSQYSIGYSVLNDQQVLATEAAKSANPDLKWEKTAQFDVGIDLGVVKNRIHLTADYYVKTTKDLLLNVELPATVGFTSVLRNVGSVENRGFELGINTINIESRGFKWTTEGNISFNKNKVLKLADDAGQFYVGNESEAIVKIGEPLGSFYGTVFDGIWQTKEEIAAAGGLAISGALPGAPKFKDINNDGVYNQSTDRTIIGNGLPKYIFGLTNTFTYKGFDLSVFLQGVQGNQIFNSTFRSILGGDAGANQLKEYFDGAWRTQNTNNKYYSVRQWNNIMGISSYNIEDGSFLRIKNISVAYRIPLNTKIIKRVKVYVSAQNLATFTKYRGYDPEVNSDSNSNTVYGSDRFSYPASRTFTIGGNFSF